MHSDCFVIIIYCDPRWREFYWGAFWYPNSTLIAIISDQDFRETLVDKHGHNRGSLETNTISVIFSLYQSKKVEFSKTFKQWRWCWKQDVHVCPMALQKNITDNNINDKGYNKLTAGITPRKNLNIKAYHVTIRNIGSWLV